MSIAEGLLLACSGFLLAVLWMDLIFDTQVLAARGDDVPEPVLASIAGYYRRATTTSRPMSHLIAVAMVVLLGALIFRTIHGPDPIWVTITSGVLAGAPILLAAIRTVPNAVRMGNRPGGLEEQSRLARSICSDHVLCFASMFAFIAFQLVCLVWTPAGNTSAGSEQSVLQNRRQEPNDAMEGSPRGRHRAGCHQHGPGCGRLR